MTTKELTYKKWLAGKFELSTVYSIKVPNAKNLAPSVDPQSIQEEELNKIHIKQQEIFEAFVEKYKGQLIEDFDYRYTKSPFPQKTIKIQANDIIATVRGQKQKFAMDDYIVEKTGQLMPKNFLINFQNYANLRLRGETIKPNFVPSPNSKLFDHGHYMLPEVYLESNIALYEHLSKFDSSIDPIRLFQDPYKSLFADEPFNSAPEIFVSGFGQHLFHEIEEVLVTLPPKPGDYVLIYKMLRHPVTNAIKSNISLEKLFNYVNLLHNLQLKPGSNKPATSELKKNILRFFLRRYLYKTRSHDKNEIAGLLYKIIEQKTT